VTTQVAMFSLRRYRLATVRKETDHTILSVIHMKQHHATRDAVHLRKYNNLTNDLTSILQLDWP
jgi:hypothetical protein